MKKTTLMVVTLSLVGAVANAGAQAYVLSNSFTTALNPDNGFSFGHNNGTNFVADSATTSVNNFNFYTTGGNNPLLSVGRNMGSGMEFGIGPGQVSLESDYTIPEIQWTAITTGRYSIYSAIGGTLASDSYGTGNANANSAQLFIGGTSQNGIYNNSNNNNVMSWDLSNINLTAGETVDILVGQHLGSGNTQALFTISEFQAAPEPGTIALAIGIGLFGLLKVRRNFA